MSVIKYKRGSAVQLTASFNLREFDCKGGSCCGCGCTTTLVDTRLVRKLQVLRRQLGNKPIIINSGYRCPTHNRCQGGASSSYHTKGQAADIRCTGVSAAAIAKKAQELGFTGIGDYGNRVHVDVRKGKYFYRHNGREVAVSTHGGVRKQSPYTLSTRTLRRGSTGNDVRAAQWILNWAGYTCTVDGVFGKKTEAAVKAFQKDMLLEADGVIGKLTLGAMREVYT